MSLRLMSKKIAVMAVSGRELVTLAILAVLLAPAAAVAEYRKLDGIVAVVDDDVYWPVN